MDANYYDVTILGSGPSGLTAAIYTSRAFLKTLVLGGNPPGGQLINTTDVENFPGFPEGILGPQLINNMRIQAEKFETSFIDENAMNISGTFETGFTVNIESGKQIKTKSIIIATGASAKWLGLPEESNFFGRGVSACATCDGFFFKDKVVAVVGGGDAAMEESTFLTKFASKVYVLVRGTKEQMRASAIMKDRAFGNEKIQFLFNTEVQGILGESKVAGLNLLNNSTKESFVLPAEGLFVAIGHKPNTDFLKGTVDIDEKGYIKVTNFTHTSALGIFVSGDVHDFRYKQAITAAGMGCMAALDVEKLLSEKK